ncbi:pyridoxal phosphate-dependent transferase [Dissophora ornata]|nr:Aromatic/aminoadipate aminotransferase 1 [Dissophora ornata]KAI8599033.1 pyridoxal phosphate-dependent transferase [Dissophora ornata]
MSTAQTSQLPMAKDFTPFLSIEGASRKKSPLKALIPLMKGDMISLGGGLPHPSTFPFYSLSSDVKSMKPVSAVSEKASSTVADVVTVPHGPQAGKAENLSASLQYGLGTGIKSLREFCKEHVNRMHRPQYQDWDVVLSAGNTDAFSKAISMLCNRGDKILVEEWTYPTALETLEPVGVGHVPVHMDGEGMSAVALKDILDNWGSTPEQANDAKPRVVYLIPTGQNPTGSTMSIQRRRDIMQVAREHDLILIEDDPYYYLQFFVGEKDKDGNTIGLVPTLLSMDTDGRVIRLDTFSKTLVPGCRVGYMSMNAHFCMITQYHNEVTIQQPSGFSQALLAEMLISHWGQEGYTRYLCENVRTEYLRRSQHLQACLRKHVDNKLASFIEPSAGMFIWIKVHVEQHPRYGTVADSVLMLELFRKSVENNVLMVPGWQFSCKAKPADVDIADLMNTWYDDQATYLRATFAYASFEQMEEATIRFGEALKAAFSS